MKSRIFALLIFIVHIFATEAKSTVQNVVINSASDEYSFVEGSKGPEVRHVRKVEYLATRHSQKIQPHIFYNNVVRLDKASGGKLQYRNVNSPTVFHDDSKVCFFDLFLEAKGKKGKAEFRRTFTDAAHFTEVFVEEEWPVINKTLTFNIPSSMSGIRLVDANFPSQGIVRNEESFSDGSRRVTYTVTGLSEMPDDKSAPSALVCRPHITVAGYFPDTDSLYRYHKHILEVDTVIDGVNDLLSGILGDASDSGEIIDKLYAFVCRSIRYVAFEEGEAAFRPETPSETLRKHYGDCKSMSLLLATLLNRAGIEACVATVGTNSIPYRIAENPSLAAADHMICVVRNSSGTLFLDPTHEQISSRHIPVWIRGKDAMMFTPDGYSMVDIPNESPCASVDEAVYEYSLSDEGFIGRVSRECTEDMAEMLYSSISSVPGQHLKGVVAKMLVPSVRASVFPDSVKLDDSFPGKISFSAPISNPSALTEVNGCIYLDLNTSGDPFTEKIDTVGRRSDYAIPALAKIIRKSSVVIPHGMKVGLPDNYEASSPHAKLSCRFCAEGNSVTMTKILEVQSLVIPLSDIPEWNRRLAEWNEACNQQIEITEK